MDGWMDGRMDGWMDGLLIFIPIQSIWSITINIFTTLTYQVISYYFRVMSMFSGNYLSHSQPFNVRLYSFKVRFHVFQNNFIKSISR